MSGRPTPPDLSFSNLQLPSPVTQISDQLLHDKDISLFIKRDELIHPVLQGNKWRKLKYNLLAAQQQQQSTLLSFGGPYSNHLHALAYAGKLFHFNTIGIIRGEAPAILNPCLQDMQNWGMQLEFISRKEYKQKNEAVFIQKLEDKFARFYLIPEGGNNIEGRRGCAELLDELTENYDIICCEVGSGTMFTSLLMHNVFSSTRYLGFIVMKNLQLETELNRQFMQQNINHTQWSINHDYHLGGFAKAPQPLHDFILEFKQQHNIQLEPVYSGKMLYGIYDLIKQNYFKSGSRILCIHGGGLQGLRGFADIYA